MSRDTTSPGGLRVALLAATCCAVVGLALLSGTAASAASPGGVRAHLVDVTTTTDAPPPTTVPPTTVPPTTTEPSTTSRPERSTTTEPASTTTTTTPTTNTSSSTPWALIIVIIVLVLAILLVILLLVARNKKNAEATWRRVVVPGISDAELARQSLLSDNVVSDNAELRGAVSVQVERASTALDRAVTTAPDPEAGELASSAAGALRGLAFAIEADRLLRHGAAAPSGAQLAQADEARRAGDSELNTALARLSTRVGPDR